MESKIKSTKAKKATLDKFNDLKKNKEKGLFYNIWSLIYLSLRGYMFASSSFNYAHFQGTGYSYAFMPFFKKIFKNNKEKFKETMIENLEFFNTGTSFFPTIGAIHLLMLERGYSKSEIRSVKFSLMGPLAGIHDSLFGFGTRPLFAGIAASLSSTGSMSGFWFWLLGFNIWSIVFRTIVTIIAYRGGQSALGRMSGLMGEVIKISSMIGVTIISALAVSYTKVNLGINTTNIIQSNGILAIQTVSYQEILDKIIPFLLPVLLVLFLYVMSNKFKWSMYKTLVFLIILGMTGYVYGVFV